MKLDVRSRSFRNWRHGWTLVEILVSIGIVGILLSLALPAMGRVRHQARLAASLSNIRQCGAGVIGYAAENADLPPVLFPPREAYLPPDRPDVFVGRGIRTTGLWWDHQSQWHVLLTPVPPPQACWAPGHRSGFTWVIDQSPAAVTPNYYLTWSLYADPAYWDRFTQRGPAQWRAQHLTNIRHPSDKGLMWQSRVYGVKEINKEGWQFSTSSRLKGKHSSVLWADSSATTEDMLALNPGEPNFYFYQPRSVTYMTSGYAVQATRDGIYGRDRGGAESRPTLRSLVIIEPD